jgi:hypothetical protein
MDTNARIYDLSLRIGAHSALHCTEELVLCAQPLSASSRALLDTAARDIARASQSGLVPADVATQLAAECVALSGEVA